MLQEKFFCIRNLLDNKIFHVLPWEFVKNIPSNVKTKEDLKRWWRNPEANHLFYSLYEAQHNNLRLSNENKAVRMHGFVIDYDAEITKAMYDNPHLSETSIAPYAWSLTCGGRGRMVWVFDKPLLLPDKETTKVFLKKLVKKYKLDKIWPGFDEAFYNTSQYYEVGHSWKIRGGELLKVDIFQELLGQAWEECNRDVKTPMPLDEIYREIERKYPGKWKGPFQLGQRTYRFWDPTASNPTAAILRPNGFQCFSGPKPFITWKELLGQEFVDKITANKIYEISNDIYFDGKFYYTRTAENDWITHTQDNMKLYLKVKFGLSTKAQPYKQSSELEDILCYIQEKGRIEAALPFVMRKSGIIYYHGKRYLNVAQNKALEPVSPQEKVTQINFPWISKFLITFFDNELQLPYFLAWLKRFYEGCLFCKPCGGQAVFIVGPRNRGKTLLSNYIVAKMVGGFTEGASFLLGEHGNFSAAFLEKPLITVDDTTVSTDEARHTKYSAILKRMVANKDFLYNQKFQKSGNVQWTGRIIVTCNTDPESLRVLPNVEMTILDKIMLFKTSLLSHDFKEGFIDNIDKELPYFCRWLLDWKVPQDIQTQDDRFGVAAYHHPTLYRCAVQSGPSQAFFEVLQIFLKDYRSNYTQTWVGSAAALLAGMQNTPSTSGISSKYSVPRVSQMLGQLQARGYPIVNKHTRGGNIWEIPCDLDNIELKTHHDNALVEEELDDITFDPEAITRNASIFQHDGSELIHAHHTDWRP